MVIALVENKMERGKRSSVREIDYKSFASHGLAGTPKIQNGGQRPKVKFAKETLNKSMPVRSSSTPVSTRAKLHSSINLESFVPDVADEFGAQNIVAPRTPVANSETNSLRIADVADDQGNIRREYDLSSLVSQQLAESGDIAITKYVENLVPEGSNVDQARNQLLQANQQAINALSQPAFQWYLNDSSGAKIKKSRSKAKTSVKPVAKVTKVASSSGSRKSSAELKKEANAELAQNKDWQNILGRVSEMKSRIEADTVDDDMVQDAVEIMASGDDELLVTDSSKTSKKPRKSSKTGVKKITPPPIESLVITPSDSEGQEQLSESVEPVESAPVHTPDDDLCLVDNGARRKTGSGRVADCLTDGEGRNPLERLQHKIQRRLKRIGEFKFPNTLHDLIVEEIPKFKLPSKVMGSLNAEVREKADSLKNKFLAVQNEFLVKMIDVRLEGSAETNMFNLCKLERKSKNLDRDIRKEIKQINKRVEHFRNQILEKAQKLKAKESRCRRSHTEVSSDSSTSEGELSDDSSSSLGNSYTESPKGKHKRGKRFLKT